MAWGRAWRSPDPGRVSGLRNITERVRMLGGKLNVVTAPGQGTPD